MPEIAPIVGQPVAYGMALAMLALYVFAEFVGRYPLVLAHEGGHMLALIFFLRPIDHWVLNDNATGGTTHPHIRWAPSNLFIAFAGYATPPVLGLGGAAVVASGNAWGVLLLTFVLCVLALVPARKWGLAFLIPLLVVLGIAWVLIDGTPDVRAAVAVGIVWYLLLGGIVRIFHVFRGSGDSEDLRKMTLVPEVVWSLLWILVGFACLIKGGSLLLARS